MPSQKPPRRRPASQGIRRPRVAGHNRPTTEPAPVDAVDQDSPVAPADLVDQAPERPVDEPEPAGQPSRVERASQDEAVESGEDAVAPAGLAGTRLIGAPAVTQGDESDEESDPAETEPRQARKPRPRPSGKGRTTGEPRPDSTGTRQADGSRPAPKRAVSAQVRARAAGSRAINRAILMVVAALMLAGAALWFKGEADSLTAGADSANRAITDVAATSEAAGKLTVAVERTLSYDYADLDANATAVRENLTGQATCQYEHILGELKKIAQQRKVVVTAKVRDLGIQRLDGDKVDALVFTDQSATYADENKTTASASLFAVRGERQGGVWKLTNIDFLGQALPGGVAQPVC
ncbi:hypothetical protein [Actinokineospora enzanensis]|uniref:hypothetical protein n=1 Tax=Actinokineospora enzanensis TaxID=155975 RepID=UPI0003763A8C|nr:hypothetical protein [Actinokineospora enzanensis]